MGLLEEQVLDDVSPGRRVRQGDVEPLHEPPASCLIDLLGSVWVVCGGSCEVLEVWVGVL